MDGISLTPEQEKLNALRKVLPEVFSEGKIDWEKLKATLGEDINFTNERYVLNWAGKSDAFKVLQTPTSKTLVPSPEESVKKDGTAYQKGESFKIIESDNPTNPNSDNIFIEGENLEVLKVLQKSYFGKVKMIYIDPPYNTGNDSFIYPDKFSESKADYEKRVGDKDEEGYMTKDGMFKKNSKENGQYHSNWLNMMMPRLYLAKNLMRQDGVIFVSIDDNEVHNLRLLMNEIFGEENFVGKLIIQTATDNNPTQINTEHEYVICFSKQKDLLGKWFNKSKNAEKIYNQYEFLKEKFGNDFATIQEELRKWIKKNKSDLSKVTHYDNVDSKGVFHDGDIANTRFGGYEYNVIHPETGKPCKIPDKGFRFPEETLVQMIEAGEVMFGKDETILIKPKKRIENAKDILRSIIYEDGRASTKIVDELVGRSVFDNPKSHFILSRLIGFVLNGNDIILDFFAGSGTTAHAVMDLNKEDASTGSAQVGQRKYICVQLPELCDEKSEAFKAGYKTIAEISKERIRRAGKKIDEEIKKEITDVALRITKLQGELPTEENKSEIANLQSKIQNLQSQDLGFKVLKLEDSNFKQWQQIEGKDTKALVEQMKLFVDPVSETATIENIVYELLLKSGKDLNSSIEYSDGYYLIGRNEMALILEKVDQTIVKKVMNAYPKKVIVLDKLFEGNDQLKTNTVLQMKDAGIEFKTI